MKLNEVWNEQKHNVLEIDHSLDITRKSRKSKEREEKWRKKKSQKNSRGIDCSYIECNHMEWMLSTTMKRMASSVVIVVTTNNTELFSGNYPMKRESVLNYLTMNVCVWIVRAFGLRSKIVSSNPVVRCVLYFTLHYFPQEAKMRCAFNSKGRFCQTPCLTESHSELH